ncbi:hypothetical protein [Streptomyces cremeus]|uniref:Uncharacterized protein n=1 Tax=Streptomyces cremeus TaxID=66881 RepID=A0ABV5PAA8_STRCM
MTRLPQQYADGHKNHRDLDRVLLAAHHELMRRERAVREARRAVRRARRAVRAQACRRIADTMVTPSRCACAAFGSVAFVVGVLLLAQGSAQAGDMLSVAAAFWALAVMIRRAR